MYYWAIPEKSKQGRGGGDIWNFQGYQRNGMWHFQGLIKKGI